jgi:predicted nucleic acid-binding protein
MATVAINDVIYAGLSVRFATIELLDVVLHDAGVAIEPMPRPALFLAGKAFQRYRASGGRRTGVLPDFFIGAHAAVERLVLLTRDARRCRHYFPTIDLVAPQPSAVLPDRWRCSSISGANLQRLHPRVFASWASSEAKHPGRNRRILLRPRLQVRRTTYPRKARPAAVRCRSPA